MSDLDRVLQITKPRKLKQEVYHIDMSKHPALNIWLRDLAKKNDCTISHVVRTILSRSMRREKQIIDGLPIGNANG